MTIYLLSPNTLVLTAAWCDDLLLSGDSEVNIVWLLNSVVTADRVGRRIHFLDASKRHSDLARSRRRSFIFLLLVSVFLVRFRLLTAVLLSSVARLGWRAWQQFAVESDSAALFVDENLQPARSVE